MTRRDASTWRPDLLFRSQERMGVGVMSIIYDDGQRVVYDPFAIGTAVKLRGDRVGVVTAVWDDYDDDGYPLETWVEVQLAEDEFEQVSTWELTVADHQDVGHS